MVWISMFTITVSSDTNTELPFSMLAHMTWSTGWKVFLVCLETETFTLGIKPQCCRWIHQFCQQIPSYRADAWISVHFHQSFITNPFFTRWFVCSKVFPQLCHCKLFYVLQLIFSGKLVSLESSKSISYLLFEISLGHPSFRAGPCRSSFSWLPHW